MLLSFARRQLLCDSINKVSERRSVGAADCDRAVFLFLDHGRACNSKRGRPYRMLPEGYMKPQERNV